jgi:aspartate-semialdehyde dehydrogenase
LVHFRGTDYPVVSIAAAIAIFSAGGSVSLEFAPKFTEVVDNSSAWRMDPGKKLMVPGWPGHCFVVPG